jgi:hypothetical protein
MIKRTKSIDINSSCSDNATADSSDGSNISSDSSRSTNLDLIQYDQYTIESDVSAIESEYSDSSEEEYDRKGFNDMKNWSPTETINIMVGSDNKVAIDIFQIYVKEMLRDKCWSKTDMEEFHRLMKTIVTMMEMCKTDDEMMTTILNPKFYNTIHYLLDRLDTMNAICVMSTDNKCDMISDPKNREKMKQQINIITKLIDVYAPIFIKLMLMDDKIIKELSQEKLCDIDPEYMEIGKNLQSKLIGIIYMRKLSGKSHEEQMKLLKKLSNDVTDVANKQISSISSANENSLYPIKLQSNQPNAIYDDINSHGSNDREIKEQFGCNRCNESGSYNYSLSMDLLVWLIILLIVGVFVYVIKYKE